eukprot:Nitzschia sp. Nitz4//scaffold9_size221794//197136//199181//NITZ4_001382-RA/size221794-snap-gene-0.197-mRNA-1//-1//CDS//3329561109//5523//frame0
MSSYSSDERKRPAVIRDNGSKTKKVKGGYGTFHVRPLIKAGDTGTFAYSRYNDEVHRSIDLCPLMQTVTDTWPLQRLRFVKQLGTTFLVYATGDHTRFAHSVGVAHLAKEMCARLKAKYRFLQVKDKDVLCVTLAGLMHDTGHGPFSHLYEVFREDIKEECKRDSAFADKYKKFPSVPKEWTHEQSSLMMVDAVLESLGLQIDLYNLDQPLKQIGDGIDANTIRCYWSDCDEDNEILTSRDWVFIKECIYGKPLQEVKEKLGINRLIGRERPELEWLYGIVSNSFNGIDVDKADYFARDVRRTMGEAGHVDISIINEAVIAKAKCPHRLCPTCSNNDMHYQICYPWKCIVRVQWFFLQRGRLHEDVYQHKTGEAAASMVTDILKLADVHYLIPTGRGFSVPISQAFYYPEAFRVTTDSILEGILKSESEELRPARELAERFMRRDLYKFAGERVLRPNSRQHQDLFRRVRADWRQVAKEICASSPRHDEVLTEDDFIVKCCSWHQGAKDKNPLLNVRFVEKSLPYSKSRKDCPTAIPVEDLGDYEMFTTRTFQKRVVRVYAKVPSKRDLVAHAFEDYWVNYVEGVVRCTRPPRVNFGGFEQADSGEASADSGDESLDGMSSSNDPVQLTQESGDEMDAMSPTKSPGKFSSPIPLLRHMR